MAGRAISAGVLAYRWRSGRPQVLLVHPGGPYWRGKDAAAWSIPKGLTEPGEDGWAAARREFEEELGQPIGGEGEELPPCRLPSGKVVRAWLVEADLDLTEIRSNVFEMEWPPKSGRKQAFPEIDQAAWLEAHEARAKIHKGQRPLLEAALARIGRGKVGGLTENRTRVRGFAVRCVTTPPSGRRKGRSR